MLSTEARADTLLHLTATDPHHDDDPGLLNVLSAST